MKLHRMRHHSATRDFKCSYSQCSMSFKSSVDLKRHLSNWHEERNLPCDHPGCDQKYANSSALTQHKRTVHSTRSLVCSTLNCSYRTSIAANLRSHMIVHEDGNEKILCSMEGCGYKGQTLPVSFVLQVVFKAGLS